MVILPGKEMEGTGRDRGCLARLDFVTLPEINEPEITVRLSS